MNKKIDSFLKSRDALSTFLTFYGLLFSLTILFVLCIYFTGHEITKYNVIQGLGVINLILNVIWIMSINRIIGNNSKSVLDLIIGSFFYLSAVFFLFILIVYNSMTVIFAENVLQAVSLVFLLIVIRTCLSFLKNDELKNKLKTNVVVFFLLVYFFPIGVWKIQKIIITQNPEE